MHIFNEGNALFEVVVELRDEVLDEVVDADVDAVLALVVRVVEVAMDEVRVPVPV